MFYSFSTVVLVSWLVIIVVLAVNLFRVVVTLYFSEWFRRRNSNGDGVTNYKPVNDELKIPVLRGGAVFDLLDLVSENPEVLDKIPLMEITRSINKKHNYNTNSASYRASRQKLVLITMRRHRVFLSRVFKCFNSCISNPLNFAFNAVKSAVKLIKLFYNIEKIHDLISNKTISGLIFADKLKLHFKVVLFLYLAMLSGYGVSIFSEYSVSPFMTATVAVWLVLMEVNLWLMKYRIRSGVYGTTRFDAEEAIAFIMSHSDKNDFNDSGGPKKFVSDSRIVPSTASVSNAGGAAI